MGESRTSVIAHMLASGGVITRERAYALGMSPRTISRRIASGEFVAVGDGVIVLAGVLLEERSLLGAATTALGAVVSHHSAARLYGVTGINPSLVSVSVPVRRTNRFRNVYVHQLTDIRPNHVRTRSGLATTIPSRIPVDLAAVLDEDSLADVVDQLVRRRHTSYPDISETLESLARCGKPGVVKLRSVIAPRLGGTYISDSTLESRLFQLIVKAQLPLPDTQYRPRWLRHRNGRVDLVYLDHRLVIEGDSMKHHGAPEPFQKDRERDNAAQLAGWRILRFTWYDITERPSYVVASIRTALAGPPAPD